MANQNKIYDTIIIGGGPAGYTSALYTSRAGLNTLLIEKFSAGGQMTQTEQIDNYPGYDETIDGFTLGFKMKQGSERFGTESLQAEVLSVDLISNPKKVVTDTGEYLAKTVIIATGADHKHLGIDKENELIGKGVSYCAACDGMFYRDKTVVVIGGGNSAVADALLLSRVCKKVYLVHRRDTLRATKIYHNTLLNSENVEFKWNSQIDELLNDSKINGVKIKNIKTNETEEIDCDGVFISIGRTPSTKLFENQLKLDESGYIVADESTKTNIAGVFVVGDVRTKVVRQIITAAADGAVASHFAEEFLAENYG